MKKTVLSGLLLTLLLMSPALLRAEDPPPQHARGDLKSPSSQAAIPDGTSQTLPQVQTYDQLVAAIRRARAASQARVEQAVQQEKVRECWEIGKLIDEHVLQHQRADYGEQVLLRLSKDLSLSETELGYMLQFARAYPISQPAGKLSWSHYMVLLSLNDIKEQDAVADMAEKGNWTRDQVREEVKKRKAARQETPAPVQEAPLMAKPGKPGTYRIVKAAVGPETGKGVIDLGFSNYYRTSRDLRFKEGAIIEVMPAFPGAGSAPSDLIKLSKRTSADLYTYRAWVVDVLDGDTLKAVVDLGFGVRSVQVLRLRGLDAPELVSKEGKEAKAFLESVIAPVRQGISGGSPSSAEGGSASGGKQSQPSILIKTVKSDKYDRYLADLFVTDKEGKTQYVNNLLLENEMAVRVRE